MRKPGCDAYKIFGSRSGVCPLGGFFLLQRPSDVAKTREDTMKKEFLTAISVPAVLLLAACSVGGDGSAENSPSVNTVMSTEEKQIEACIKDVKRALHDPNSLELLSHSGREIGDGTYRIKIFYTAKNRMGGRVRGDSLCGFKSEDSAEWNPEDIFNQERDLAVRLRDSGINLR